MAVKLLQSSLRRILAKESEKWNPDGPWRLPSVAYTLEHKLAFLEREHYLTGKYSLRGVFHDWEKPILYLIPGLQESDTQRLHRYFQPHHVGCPKQSKIKHLMEAYIDWDCAAVTKPDKPLDSFGTLLHFYQKEIELFFPICLAMNPSTVVPEIADLDERRRQNYPQYLFQNLKYNQAIFARAVSTLCDIYANLPENEEQMKRFKKNCPKNIKQMKCWEIFLQTLFLLSKKRHQKINYFQMKEQMRESIGHFKAYKSFVKKEKPAPLQHDYKKMMPHPYFS